VTGGLCGTGGSSEQGKAVVRVETVSANARQEAGAPNQRAIEDVLVRTRVVGGWIENQPERPRRAVVAISMVVCVAVVVVCVTVRHGFFVERDLLDGDVCSRSPRPRRDWLGKHQGQGTHRSGGPRSTAHGWARRATQTHDCPSSRAILARTA
jgi:hypothetical protein